MIFDWDKYQKDKECSLITCDSDTLPHHVALSSSHVKPGVLCEINIRKGFNYKKFKNCRIGKMYLGSVKNARL